MLSCSFFIVFILFCESAFAANVNTCADLGLLSGGHPTEFMWTNYSGNSPQTSSITWAKNGTVNTSFTSRITCTEDGDDLVIESSGIPAHNIGKFPMTTSTTGRTRRDGQPQNDNPNTISVQTYRWRIPKVPTKKSSVPQSVLADQSALPYGPIGFALNGVPFFNPFNAQGLDAVSRNSNGFEVMDLCHGHPTEMGAYHHHFQMPTDGCLFGENGAQIPYNASERSPKIGYAFDGIPIYGPRTAGGVMPNDLDACSGRDDAELGMYVYHITELTAPYIIGCYRYRENTNRMRPPGSLPVGSGAPPIRTGTPPVRTGTPTAGAQGAGQTVLFQLLMLCFTILCLS
jgi:hypothetical protein